jgi:hypothetical protein
MLHKATAAGARMGARRFLAIRRRRDDAGVFQTVAVQIALNLFAGQHLGDEDLTIRPLRDTIAMVPDAFDHKFHSAASLSSMPMNPPDWRFQ